MDSFISIIKYLASSNLINFLIMMGLLYWVCSKINMKSSFDSSIEKVESDINKSDEAKMEAEKLLLHAKSELEMLPEDIKRIRLESDKKAEILTNDIKQETKKTIETIKNNVVKVINNEEKNISDDLSSKLVSAVMAKTKNNIKSMLKTDSKLHKKFIEESLRDLEEVKL